MASPLPNKLVIFSGEYAVVTPDCGLKSVATFPLALTTGVIISHRAEGETWTAIAHLNRNNADYLDYVLGQMLADINCINPDSSTYARIIIGKPRDSSADYSIAAWLRKNDIRFDIYQTCDTPHAFTWDVPSESPLEGISAALRQTRQITQAPLRAKLLPLVKIYDPRGGASDLREQMALLNAASTTAGKDFGNPRRELSVLKELLVKPPGGPPDPPRGSGGGHHP